MRSRGLRFWSTTTVPHSGSRAYDELASQLELPDGYGDFGYALERGGVTTPLSHHHLLGHSWNVQGDMQLEAQLVMNGVDCGGVSADNDPRFDELSRGADDWMLLLQLDSDGDELMWGTGGLLYFWIRKQDLAAKRFDRCWMTLQCT